MSRLVAVQRYENNGDIQPHPCFCVTTIGFWRQIGGDWHAGETWLDRDDNEVTDVGGNLLAILKERDIHWLPLRRVNRVNPHPLLFGLYGDDDGPIVYHHGAGFRSGFDTGRDSRRTRAGTRKASRETCLDLLPERRPFRRLRRLDPYFRIEREMVMATDRLERGMVRATLERPRGLARTSVAGEACASQGERDGTASSPHARAVEGEALGDLAK